jgi:hypothetical protein
MPTFARTPLTAVLAFACGLSLAGGIATAASRSTGSAKACISKKGVLSLLHHGKCAKGTHKIKLGAQGPKGAKGGSGPRGLPGVSATKYWATVNSDGTLKRGSSGVTSSELTSGSNPYYAVTFPVDISACAPIATLTATTASPLTLGEVFAAVQHDINAGASPDLVVVQVHTEGTAANLTATSAFNLAVMC